MLLRLIGLLFLLQHGLNGNQIVDHVVVSKLNEPLSINLSFDLSKPEDSDLSIKLASKIGINNMELKGQNYLMGSKSVILRVKQTVRRIIILIQRFQLLVPPSFFFLN